MPFPEDISRLVSHESYNNISDASKELARKINEGCEIFDTMAFLPWGGIIPTIIGQVVGFDKLDGFIYPITHNPDYPDNSIAKYKIGPAPPSSYIRNRRVLLVGDVWRSGSLLKRSREGLIGLGAAHVTIGAVYVDEQNFETKNMPDYFGVKTGKFIEFPWNN